MPDTVIITIDSLGAKGDGVGTLPDGRRVFVVGALPGETVAVEPGEARGDGLAARLVEVIEASPQRVPPPCRHFYHCGGCVLQQMEAEAYRGFKLDRVRHELKREGLPDGTIEGPFISPPGSRRRVTLAAYRGHDRFVLGFNEQRSNKIVDLEECPVTRGEIVAMLPALRRTLAGILQPGQGMDVAVMASGLAVDMVLRPWTKRKSKDEQMPRHVAEKLAALAEELKLARLSWQNSADDDSDLTRVAWRAPFTIDFSGTTVIPPPGAFLQATAEGEAALVAAVLAPLKKKSRVADLYAGCGTFTFAMAAERHKVHAVEGYAAALDALKIAMPGRPVTAEKRDLAKDPLLAKEMKDYDAVVMDPPRVGAAEQAKMLAKSAVPLVISVSCSASSFAKDGAILQAGGYVLEKLTVVDQFLWSPHVELVGVFRRA